MTPLERVLAETARYEHPLFDFFAREREGGIELVIRPKNGAAGIHTYSAPIHAHDIEDHQFPWAFQRYLYDCLHDYIVEMFARTPQTEEEHL